MKIIGALLIIWGIADIALSWVGTDLYWEIGISVPAIIYPFTPFIAMTIGYGLYSIGVSEEESGEGEEEA